MGGAGKRSCSRLAASQEFELGFDLANAFFGWGSGSGVGLVARLALGRTRLFEGLGGSTDRLDVFAELLPGARIETSQPVIAASRVMGGPQPEPRRLKVAAAFLVRHKWFRRLAGIVVNDQFEAILAPSTRVGDHVRRNLDLVIEEIMSEYQYIGFRAVDGPVIEENLEFMHKQSSREEITAWTFDNEYHYGDFGGNAAEMLRRGYDFHLHYANFGTRKLMIRLPNGLPDAKAAEPYFENEKDSLLLLKDKTGPGQILCVKPYHEPGDLEEIWGANDLLDHLLSLRAEILDGDLRPLYLFHLAVATDAYHDSAETNDAPVPAGLDKLTGAEQALAELYDLSAALVAAASQGGPSLPAQALAENRYEAWLKRQPASRKTDWLSRLLADPRSAVKREILAEFQKDQGDAAWPTVRVVRTIADLHAAAEVIQKRREQAAAKEAARQHDEKLARMAADPMKTLDETEVLVKHRSVDAYREIAQLLADLREALAGGHQYDLAYRQAKKLTDANPKANRLEAALRKKELLPDG